MTFLFNYMQHEVLLLEAIDEFGYGALALVCAITTLGSFVLCTYFTAMYVIVYLERMGRFADVCHPFVVSSLPKARNEPATMVPLTEVITASSGDGKHDEGHHHKITLQLAVTMMVKQIKCVYAASLEKCASLKSALFGSTTMKHVMAKLQSSCARVVMYPNPLETIPTDAFLEKHATVMPWLQCFTFAATALESVLFFVRHDGMPRMLSEDIKRIDMCCADKPAPSQLLPLF